VNVCEERCGDIIAQDGNSCCLSKHPRCSFDASSTYPHESTTLQTLVTIRQPNSPPNSSSAPFNICIPQPVHPKHIYSTTTKMPPIPVHTNDPIAPTAAKPDGVTPQTADTNPQPTRTTPFSHPATTTSSANSGPPPPQPGARPIAPTASAQAPHVSSNPPAPQPGYTATHTTTETRLGGPPAQFTVPPPSDTQLAGRSTTTSTQASKPGPTTLNFGPASSQYQSEHTAEPTRKSLEHPPGYTQGPDNSPYTRGTVATGGQESAPDSTVAGTAWGLLSKAGDALKSAEEAAWKAARGK
jgi:hypothetical protein